jgi:hypothetical protein
MFTQNGSVRLGNVTRDVGHLCPFVAEAMDLSRETAMGLLTNIIQRQQDHQGDKEGGQLFIYDLLKEYLREIDSPDINELTKMGSPRICKAKSWKTDHFSFVGLCCYG